MTAGIDAAADKASPVSKAAAELSAWVGGEKAAVEAVIGRAGPAAATADRADVLHVFAWP